MKHSVFSVAAGPWVIASSHALAIEQNDVSKLIAQCGGKLSEVTPLAVSPDRDLAPVIYYEKGNSVPSCGLVTLSPQKNTTDFIELVGSEPKVNFPQCLNITSITPFKLQGKNYLSVEYISRETRDEVYRNFHYLYKDAAQGYLAGDSLNGAVAGMETTVSKSMPSPAKARDGIRSARLAYLRKTFSNWTAQERDFISEGNSSFLPFEDKRSRQCHFVAEAGATAVDTSSSAYVTGSGCVSLLASSRLTKANITYFIELFNVESGRQFAAIISVAADGKITAEQSLANKVNGAGATRDIRTAKAALVDLIH
jgi:hypothetical protein